MKKCALLAAGWVAVAGLAACTGSSSEVADLPQAPEFSLQSLDGGTLGLADYRGKVLVVDFWATWCAPCHIQADILRGLHSLLDGEKVSFLAISLGEDPETVRRFAEKNPFPYPVLVDPQDHLTAEVGIYALPTVMIVDANGRIAYLQPGISSDATLREALGQAGVTVPG